MSGALAPQLPLKLSRFTLCEELGSGGMATVYLARMDLAAGIERLVALKTIHPHLAKEKPFVDMFLDEARIASHVSHPNVCATYDFGEVDGVYYLAMEYLLGEPLFDVINRIVERFDETREVLPFLAARVIADACEGIHAAHSARSPDGETLHIVHRDVSPQNLFLTYDGTTKVVDFGCAKAAERVAHTSTGVMKGKVGYAAPEQLKSDDVDARADVWALGVCLWEAIALGPLFSRDTAVKTAMSVLQDDIELASDGRDWVPDELARIADRAIQRNRDDRYPTARDMSRDLRRFIADSGFSLESAELAEWMDFLFEDRHEERVEQAKRVQEMDLSRVHTGPLYVLSDSEVALIGEDERSMLAIPLDEDEAHAYDSDAPSREVSGPIRKRVEVAADATGHDDDEAQETSAGSHGWGWVVLLLAIAALGLTGYFAHLYYEPAPWLLELFGAERTEEPGEPDHATSPSEPPVLTETGETEAAAESGESESSEETEREESESSAEPGSESVATAPTKNTGGRARSRRAPASRTVTTVVSGAGSSYGSGPAEETQTETAASGYLSVTAGGGGWAVVYAGHRRLGRTPIQHARLAEGTHRLRVLPYGNEPAEPLVVTIRAGIEERLTLDIGAQ